MDICVPPDTDWSCKFTETELAQQRAVAPDIFDRSEAFAWSLLAALCAYRIGTCPVVVRPCAARCLPGGSYRTAIAGTGYTGAVGVIGMLNPYMTGGHWVNGCGCSSGDCSCDTISEVILPGPVGSIVSVFLDGEEIPREAYRVDNGNRLVRLDGEAWPGCQDMTLSDEDGFSVTYYRGSAPNMMTRAAAGELAAEFYASCKGEDCRLPGNVTSAVRSGEAYQFAPQDFADGDTGIPEVNAVIRIYNPAGLKSPVFVAAPEMYETRTPSWR